MNSEVYCDIIGDNLIAIGPLIAESPWILQQDNATIHVSAVTKEWFRVNNVEVLEWPPRSPDLNPIEDLWGWLVRKVYQNGRQYSDKESLKAGIREAWDQIPQEYLKALIDSIPDRLKQVIQGNGGMTKY